jgi:soluble lytic murein transglycosylase-like protein
LIQQYEDYKNKNVVATKVNEEVKKEEKRPYIEQVDSVLSKKTLDYIWSKSKENDFSYELILALIKHESKLGKDRINYNSDGSVDKGLMQINSSNVYSLSKLAHIKYPDLMNDIVNIDMAFALLNYERNYWREQKKYSEEQIYFLTILSYNIGSPRVPKFLHRYGWNSDYVDLITSYKNEFERMR